jgi:hypothetical protein
LDDSDLLDLEIAPSLIPGSGMGLFSKSEFKKGDIIAEYRGPIV